MQNLFRFILLFLCVSAFAQDNNLVIIVDNLQQETAKTEEINMTHQCMTALQQRASAVLVSTGLWKNIVDRQYNFTKQLEYPESLESAIFDMYQVTNQELRSARYNLGVINQKLSQVWFFEKYPQLAELAADRLNQLRFDFACYMFKFDMKLWHVYSAHTGMLLFIPQELNYQIDEKFEVIDEQDLCKHADKKSYVVESLEKLVASKQDRWVVYLTGHGHPKSSKQGANIAGLKIDEFKKLLDYFHNQMQLKLLVYSSCYGGGVHTIEPYADLQLHYPVIVTAATDAPIFGFGLFEGVKLPPYDAQFKLQPADVAKNFGLLPCALQNYKAFFRRAWKGWFDLNLVQLISRFFACDVIACHVQKIENFPLIRKAGDFIFRPVHDGMLIKLVQQVTSNGSYSSSKPLLLYTKKVKKIKIDTAVPIVSMLPGIQSHEITELSAGSTPLSKLITDSFLSLEDMQAYKNFMIKKLSCFDDLIGQSKNVIFTNVLILDQENFMPKFVSEPADALIYLELAGQSYLVVWYEQKISCQFILDQEQVRAMAEIKKLVQQAVDFDASASPTQLLTHDAYVDNKLYQQEIVDDCVKIKVCKK